MTGARKPALRVRLRSRAFKALFPLWTGICCVYCTPLLLRKHSRAVAYAGDLWARGTFFLLKHICHIGYELRGKEHYSPETRPYIIAGKHQSAWETAVFLHILDHPAYILKKELLAIPLFGTFLKKLEMIAVDRSAGMKAIKQMCADTSERLQEGRDAIIFPEGTRGAVDASLPYQPGAAMLYKQCAEYGKILPAAVNSGAHWSARRTYLLPGTIILEFGAPIEAGKNRDAFTAALQDDIEQRSAALMRESAEKLNEDGTLKRG